MTKTGRATPVKASDWADAAALLLAAYPHLSFESIPELTEAQLYVLTSRLPLVARFTAAPLGTEVAQLFAALLGGGGTGKGR